MIMKKFITDMNIMGAVQFDLSSIYTDGNFEISIPFRFVDAKMQNQNSEVKSVIVSAIPKALMVMNTTSIVSTNRGFIGTCVIPVLRLILSLASP